MCTLSSIRKSLIQNMHAQLDQLAIKYNPRLDERFDAAYTETTASALPAVRWKTSFR